MQPCAGEAIRTVERPYSRFPMLRQRITLLGIALALSASASGCGSQTPASTPSNTAEGLWSGTTGTNRTLTTAVLDDGTYYFFYSVVGQSQSDRRCHSRHRHLEQRKLHVTQHERLRYWRHGAGCDPLCHLYCTPVPQWFDHVHGSGHGDVHQFLQHRLRYATDRCQSCRHLHRPSRELRRRADCECGGRS